MRRHLYGKALTQSGLLFIVAAAPVLFPLCSYAGAAEIGIFESHADVGTALHPGSVTFDATARSYTVAGSGENMWSTQDAFHYAWKKASGDVALTADISFLGQGKEPHRKA